MNLTVVFRVILLVLLIICAIAVNLTKDLLQAVIIFMSYSSIMCILWILMESPDLAITEAAVGAGVSGILFLMTLKKIKTEKPDDKADKAAPEAEENSQIPFETAMKQVTGSASGQKNADTDAR